jgi:hypothetical protein
MKLLREEMTEANAARMQCAVNEAIEEAKHDHRCCQLGFGELKLERTRNVVCYGLGYRCVLTVPNYICSNEECSQLITVHPLEIGCTSTTATSYCETWITMDFCLLFRDLQLHNGLSADGNVIICLQLLVFLLTSAILCLMMQYVCEL